MLLGSREPHVTYWALLAGLFEQAPQDPLPVSVLKKPVTHGTQVWMSPTRPVPAGRCFPGPQAVHETMVVPCPSQRAFTP